MVAQDWFFGLVILLAAGCRSETASVTTVRSPVVPFHELFERTDTVRLDTSIVIGSISFLDVSDSGSLLVTDYTSRLTYLFSAEGRHLQSFSVPECLPDDADFEPWSARFVGASHILVIAYPGPAVLFNLEGACVVAKREGLHELVAKSFCAWNDSIFTHKVYDVGPASSTVYDLALEPVEDLTIDPPRLVRMNFGIVGLRGRSIDCFDDGPYYTYLENMDAMPVRARHSRIRYRPDFFERWTEDVPDTPSSEDFDRFPTVGGVFALDESTRLVSFFGLDRRWTWQDNDAFYFLGLSVASNQDFFPGRSTVAPVWPRAAANGYIYEVGDYESLPDGEVGNPLIIRYRFIVPKHNND